MIIDITTAKFAVKANDWGETEIFAYLGRNPITSSYYGAYQATGINVELDSPIAALAHLIAADPNLTRMVGDWFVERIALCPCPDGLEVCPVINDDCLIEAMRYVALDTL